MREGGFSAGILVAVLSFTGTALTLASVGVGIASAVGAFTPDNPGGNGTQSSIDPGQQIIDLQTNLAALSAEEKKTEADLVASKAAQKNWQIAAIGLSVVGVMAGAIILLNKNKSK